MFRKRICLGLVLLVSLTFSACLLPVWGEPQGAASEAGPVSSPASGEPSFAGDSSEPVLIQTPENSPAAGGAYTIVDTGQTTCYSDSGVIACSQNGPFAGQDAQYEGSQPSYVDNGDGTVTDLNTGLMWQQGYSGKMTWQ